MAELAWFFFSTDKVVFSLQQAVDRERGRGAMLETRCSLTLPGQNVDERLKDSEKKKCSYFTAAILYINNVQWM